jgi:hypothetical protein
MLEGTIILREAYKPSSYPQKGKYNWGKSGESRAK